MVLAGSDGFGCHPPLFRATITAWPRKTLPQARQSALEARANTVEVRLSEIEKKLFLNPPAA